MVQVAVAHAASLFNQGQQALGCVLGDVGACVPVHNAMQSTIAVL